MWNSHNNVVNNEQRKSNEIEQIECNHRNQRWNVKIGQQQQRRVWIGTGTKSVTTTTTIVTECTPLNNNNANVEQRRTIEHQNEINVETRST